MKKIGDLLFWKKSSNIALLISILVTIILDFKYVIKHFFLPVFIIALLSLTFFVLAEIMQFIIKRKKK
jgi:hypothetical protein